MVPDKVRSEEYKKSKLCMVVERDRYNFLSYMECQINVYPLHFMQRIKIIFFFIVGVIKQIVATISYHHPYITNDGLCCIMYEKLSRQIERKVLHLRHCEHYHNKGLPRAVRNVPLSGQVLCCY